MFYFIKKPVEKDVIVIIDGNYLRSSFINYLYNTNINTLLNIKKFTNFISNNRISKSYLIINDSSLLGTHTPQGYSSLLGTYTPHGYSSLLGTHTPQGYSSLLGTYIARRTSHEWERFIENGYIILNDKTFLDIIKENKDKEIILVGNNYYKNMMKIYDIKMYVFYNKCNKQIIKMKNVYFLENYIHLITNSNITTKIIIFYNMLKFNILLLITKITKITKLFKIDKTII